MTSYSKLRLILGDQLNANHSWYKNKNESTLYLIAELHQEQSYVNHHIQKTQAFFKSMECFAQALKKSGHRVLHLTLDDTVGYTLVELIEHLISKHKISNFEYQQPDEYRLSAQLEVLNEDKNLNVTVDSTEHFFIEHTNINKYFKPNTAHRMEAFYRKLRVQFRILLDEAGQPEGGKWNYDGANRNKMKPDEIKQVPQPLLFSNDVTNINKRIEKYGVKTIGVGTDQLLWPTSRSQAKELLQFFLDQCLCNFGYFQDSMTHESNKSKSSLWSLYHSRVSFALNAKMISPAYVIDQAIKTYRNNDNISIEQIEGFVRQILGWREFVRGIYWINMPSYKTQNQLNAKRTLPDYFWTGETKMNCMHHAITQSLNYAYAHHIQRLMVTGNFTLLTGINPDEVDDWYLGIYIDAIEWVELPNTRGMSQFADGGLLASKAYASSGNYINKMSDYCKSCHYDVKEKVGDTSCPYNSLYWGFMNKHEDKFGNNSRQAMVYKNWHKKGEDEQQAILKRYNWLLNNLNKL